MAWVEGLIGGFLDRKRAYEAEQLQLAQQRNEREARIYETLLSSPDAETRQLATAGLLESAAGPRRRSGLRGFIGEMEQSPWLARIAALSPTVTETEGVPGLPAPTGPVRLPGGSIGTPPPAEGAAAQPAESPTEPGAAPLQTPRPLTLPASRPAPPSTRQVTRPRQVIPSQADLLLSQRRAQSQGEVEGKVAGLVAAGVPEAEARQAVLADLRGRLYGGGLAGQSYAEGNVVPDPNSPTGWSQELYLRADPTIRQRIPAQPPTSQTRFYGKDLESISQEAAFGGMPYAQQSPEGAARVNAEAERRGISLAGRTEAARGQAQIETRRNTPIDIAEAARQEVPIGTTLRDLEGLTPVTPEQRTRRDAAVALAPALEKIRTLIPQVFPAESGMVGALTASAVIARKRAARDPQLAQLEAAINLALGNVARVLAAETGRLTEQDAQRARSALADLTAWTDTRESALAKLAEADAAMQNIAQAIRTPGQQLQGPTGNLAAPPPQTTPPIGMRQNPETGAWEIRR